MIFSQLKQTIRQSNDGYSGQQLIQWLDLEEDLNKEAYLLSGGTLRRLVLAMAFVGRNRTLILDEPTAALDPRVRRKVWDLILDSRKTKSLLITSHDFEEANKLSDQIYIISEGKTNRRLLWIPESGERRDVREERERISQVIRSGDFESYSLIVDKLTKRLNKRTVMPNGVSFVVKRGECMGLLGLNGSGKTSLFRVLTGDLETDSGNVWMASKSG
ncbi:unnamed protein product, partial [Oppiella nova]